MSARTRCRIRLRCDGRIARDEALGRLRRRCRCWLRVAFSRLRGFGRHGLQNDHPGLLHKGLLGWTLRLGCRHRQLAVVIIDLVEHTHERIDTGNQDQYRNERQHKRKPPLQRCGFRSCALARAFQRFLSALLDCPLQIGGRSLAGSGNCTELFAGRAWVGRPV